MKASALTLSIAIAAMTAASSQAQPTPAMGANTQMDISRNGTRPSAQGSAEHFTGFARVDPLFDARNPTRASAAIVTFEPGSRSAWHSHPLGQRLVVTSGLGWTQVEGGPVEELRPGDVVWCPPDVKHWHGAAPHTAMTHIAIQEAKDGKVVTWMEHVTDQQYRAAARSE